MASQVIRPEALRPEVRAARAAPADGPAELVMCYSKCCKLNMSKIKPGAPGCAMTDVMGIDLSFLSR